LPSLQEIFGTEGLLSQAITGFTPREAQQQMAEAVERALHLNAELIVEAGTGTGKTFGYLVPIFLSQKKTIISTGTKNLQDQLFFKDIPLIKKLFPTPSKIVLLKGRANYLCQFRLKKNLEEGRLASRQLVSQLHIIQEWSTATDKGDIAELNAVPEDSTIWREVTSTPDNCLNQDCDFYKTCFVVKARNDAMGADVLVVNHHLFFADIALQESGFGELLPGAEAVIFDEAHHIPEIASQFFSQILSSRQLLELARDAETESLKDAKDMQSIREQAENLEKTVHDMRAAFGLELRRAPWPDTPDTLIQNKIDDIKFILKTLETELKEAAKRSKSLENCWKRNVDLVAKFHALTDKTPENTVHWYETHLQSFTLQHTPMVVADVFKAHLKNHKRAWIFTSATLTVKNNFRLFIDSLGLDQALQIQLKSPFDYQKQALLYVPRALPDARAKDFTTSLIEAIIPVLEASKGKAFVLFTSYKAMELAEDILKTRISYPILLQGTMPKRELIEQFKQLGNAVLLGTSSFWYGVDVRGDALSCVIIDKLPFASPDDPILQARIKMLRKQGNDPFLDYQLPLAVLTLKQGAGRLIRDMEDRGVLVICDPRLVGARYGETFLQSLPDMKRTRDIAKVIEFFGSS
jgi:ATP-dependent DNA helicase DinG